MLQSLLKKTRKILLEVVMYKIQLMVSEKLPNKEWYPQVIFKIKRYQPCTKTAQFSTQILSKVNLINLVQLYNQEKSLREMQIIK
jgi:hypothetical protein